MTEFTMGIAGRVIRVRAMYESTKEYCHKFLTDGTPEVFLEVKAEDVDYEKGRTADRLMGDAYLETIALQRKLTAWLLARDTLLFHGSVVAVDGKAYLFAAKSGTGKSTHTRLWRQLLGEKAVMVNDDKPFLYCGGDEVLACGSPWNGKHRLGENISLPLKAICILERGEENTIARISAGDALAMLLQQSNHPGVRNQMDDYLGLIDRLAQKVAFYRLRCNMDIEAAKLSYGVMAAGKENRNED